MNDHTIDEETALLAHAKKQHKPTSLPKVQIGIVLLLQLCEPITSQSIYPYINQLISELDITGGDERKVGYYAGLIQSLFFLTEAIMVIHWSRVSDHVGRKPVLLIGLVGTSVSILLFGLSRTFWTLVISRCLCGLLNGNIGVMKSLMGELTNSSNRAEGFSLMPAVWAAGATLGPLMGGTFARPHERFPRVFGGRFWQEYPYFLPCLVASSFIYVSFIITLFSLKETVPKHIRDRTRRFSPASGDITPVDASPVRSHNGPLPLRDLLIYPVIISVSNYMALAFLNIMLNALLPLFFAMPIHIGGLGFKPSTIGYIMGSYGAGNGIFQALFFARTVRRFGERRLFIWGIVSFMPIFLLFPVMSFIARRSGVNSTVWLIIAVMLTLMIFMDVAYGCIFLYVTASSPNKRSLGATNGLSQMGVSLARAIGPVLATSLFSLSVERNMLGGYAVYAILFCISCLAISLAVLLPEKVWEERDDDNIEHSD
ncbi:major facilitator superfamily domain-containing protein [Infundibulicybe gibba]|nr:major facilitator superfamily domain-containing protein [Infundibulicybe gibba]